MYILLDMDGVLIPACSWKTPEILKDGFPEFSIRAVKALQKIMDQTGAKILLTTSHKSRFSCEEWVEVFNLRGLNTEKIESFPPNVNHLTRLEEILRWYNSSVISFRFVIIDDDKRLNALPEHLKNKLVQTSSLVGLTDFLADEAINILENDEIWD